MEEVKVKVEELEKKVKKIKSHRLSRRDEEGKKDDKSKFDTIKDGIMEIQDKIDKGPLKKCVILGSVSSGKSAFVNCLLQHEILTSGLGTITENVTRIKLVKQGTNFTYKVDELTPEGGFISTKDYSVNEIAQEEENEYMELFDTPGLDDINVDGGSNTNDANVSKLCKNSDIQILMLDSKATISQNDINSIKRYATQFTKLNLFIVYNFWDQNYDKKNAEKQKNQNIEKTKNVLIDKLRINPEKAASRIYYLSSKEILNCIENNISDSVWLADYNTMKKQIKEIPLPKIKSEIIDIKNVVISKMDAVLSELVTYRYIKNDTRVEEFEIIVDNLKSEVDKIKNKLWDYQLNKYNSKFNRMKYKIEILKGEIEFSENPSSKCMVFGRGYFDRSASINCFLQQNVLKEICNSELKRKSKAQRIDIENILKEEIESILYELKDYKLPQTDEPMKTKSKLYYEVIEPSFNKCLVSLMKETKKDSKKTNTNDNKNNETENKNNSTGNKDNETENKNNSTGNKNLIFSINDERDAEFSEINETNSTNVLELQNQNYDPDDDTKALIENTDLDINKLISELNIKHSTKNKNYNLSHLYHFIEYLNSMDDQGNESLETYFISKLGPQSIFQKSGIDYGRLLINTFISYLNDKNTKNNTDTNLSLPEKLKMQYYIFIKDLLCNIICHSLNSGVDKEEMEIMKRWLSLVHVDLREEVAYINFDKIANKCNEINKVKKHGIIGLAVAGGLVGAAGVTVGALVAITMAPAIPVVIIAEQALVAAASSAVGVTALGATSGISSYVTKKIDMSFQIWWKKYQFNIEKEILPDILIGSFESFLEILKLSREIVKQINNVVDKLPDA